MSDLTIEMQARMAELLTRFKLPTFAAEVVRRFTAGGHADALPTLLEVFEAEADERDQRKTERLLRASRLPPGKTFETLDRSRVPRTVMAKLDELATGDFLERAQNVLCFGLPGRGKTHVVAYPRNNRRYVTFVAKLYRELYQARNDFLHGNAVTVERLFPFKKKELPPLFRAAPLIYKAALLAYLERLRDRRKKREKESQDLRNLFDQGIFEESFLKLRTP